MTAFINEDMLCSACGHIWEELLDRDKRDFLYPCPACEDMSGKRTIYTPRGITNASFIAGHRDVNDKSWARAKRQKELRKQAGDAEARGDYIESVNIKREIPKI